MPETGDDLHRRVLEAAGPDARLPMPPVDEWDTFPFDGDLRVRPLEPPADEPPRMGEDPADCWRCQRGDEDAIWTDERWRLVTLPEPSGLPVVTLLEPRAHVDLDDLPDDLALDLGPLIARVNRAVLEVDGVRRVHVGRWGEGSAHLHLWFMGRPDRMLQLRSSFAAIWDDVLPPTPEPTWQENLAIVARALATGGGTALV
jgi:diadenosine tetraphosphate (Ap4A) HIT family hydrolase